MLSICGLLATCSSLAKIPSLRKAFSKASLFAQVREGEDGPVHLWVDGEALPFDLRGRLPHKLLVPLDAEENRLAGGSE